MGILDARELRQLWDGDAHVELPAQRHVVLPFASPRHSILQRLQLLGGQRQSNVAVDS